MTWALEHRQRRSRFPQELVDLGDGMLLAHAEWDVPEGEGGSRSIVLTLRDGRIADLQGFATEREARRFARRRRSSGP